MLQEDNSSSVKPRGVNKYLKWPYAILIALVAFTLMAIFDAAGATFWPVPIAMAGVAGYAFYRVNWAFPGLSNSGTKKTFGVLTPVMLLIGLSVASSANNSEKAQRIVELAKSDPSESRRLLAAADDAVLSNLKTLAPSLVSVVRTFGATRGVD